MSRRILISICICIMVSSGYSQEITIENLKTPSSPGFILLGVEPVNIERPTTPQDLTGAFSTAIVNGKLSPNFAVEFTPYQIWCKKQILNYQKKQQGFNDFYQKITLSIATSSSDTIVFGSLNQGLGLGYGLRIPIYDGSYSKLSNARVTEVLYGQEMKLLLGLAEENGTKSKNEFEKILSDRINLTAGSNNPNLKIILKDLYKRIMDHKTDDGLDGTFIQSERDAIDNAADAELKKIELDKYGFFWDLAAAGVHVFQGNNFGQGVFAKFGVWTNICYRFDLSPKNDEKRTTLEGIALGRFLWNEQRVDTSSYFDFGGRVVFENNKWNVSLESIGRYALDNTRSATQEKLTWRLAGKFEYALLPNLNLNFVFGKNFDQNTFYFGTGNSTMFGMGGLDISLGKVKARK